MTSNSLFRFSSVVTAAVIAACLGSGVPASGQVASSDEEKPVTASLVADATAAEPGTTLTLGVLFKMKPDWHIYWRNPGETGFATEVQWATASGPLTGETLYPAPISFVSPGDLISFGYEKEVLLMTEVPVPADAKGELQFTAKAKWLMCSDRCIPGRDTLTLNLPVGKGKPDNAELFRRYREQLPRILPAGSFPQGVSGSSKVTGNKREATLTIDPGTGKIVGETRHDTGLHRLYFYPYPPEQESGAVAGTPVVPEPDSTAAAGASGQVKVYTKPVTITVSVESGETSKPAPAHIRGVLVIQRLGADGKPQSPEQVEITL